MVGSGLSAQTREGLSVVHENTNPLALSQQIEPHEVARFRAS